MNAQVGENKNAKFSGNGALNVANSETILHECHCVWIFPVSLASLHVGHG